MSETRGRGLRREHLEGRYANYFKIGHNPSDFVMDFGQLYNGDSQPRLHTRIILSPIFAREFLDLLHRSVSEYEGLRELPH